MSKMNDMNKAIPFAASLIFLAGCFTTSFAQKAEQTNAVKSLIKEAFEQTHQGFSSDEVILDDLKFNAFIEACRKRLPNIETAEFGWTLINLRKAGQLSDVTVDQINRSDVDSVLHIAEICSRTMLDKHKTSIDRVMVDPEMRNEFNQLAIQAFGKQLDLYLVRKAAFRLRKSRRLRPELITRIADWGRKIENHTAQELRDNLEQIVEAPGIYIFRDESGYLYIGESGNLRSRLKQHFEESSNQSLANYLAEQTNQNLMIELHIFEEGSRIKEVAVRRAYESELIQSRKPKFNLAGN